MQRQEPVFELQIRRLTAFLVSGAALIVCACLGVIVWVLSISTASVDRTVIDGEHRLLHSVIETYGGNLSRTVTDYASWDELYNNFTRGRDPAWEKDNLGPYITTAFDVDIVAVTTVKGTIAYFYKRGGAAAMSPAGRATLTRLTRLAYATKPNAAGSVVSGAVMFGGRMNLVSVSPITPTSPARVGERSGAALAELRVLDAAMLSKIDKNFGVSGLRVVRSAPNAVELSDPSGKPSGYVLAWTTAKSGVALFNRVLPAVILTGLLLLIGFTALVVFCWRIVEHFRKSQARILKAEIDATRARASAAEEMARGKSAFIANMSHELRTPLNAIIGFAEIMDCESMGPVGVPRYKEYIKAIYDSGHHLLHIINDILLVSKVEAGKFSPSIEDAPFAEVLNDTLRMLEIMAGRRAITLDASRCAADAVVSVDRQALRQILLNVISNAMKFSPDGATVEIASAAADGMLEVRVRDHGCGIPPDTLREIGKPFVQAEGVYTRNSQGTGLGLAISFRLAAAMGGAISVASTVGDGTTVTLRLKTAIMAAAAEVA
jgi:signal transduction histidine kinase